MTLEPGLRATWPIWQGDAADLREACQTTVELGEVLLRQGLERLAHRALPRARRRCLDIWRRTGPTGGSFSCLHEEST
jgi:hypothetical protein